MKKNYFKFYPGLWSGNRALRACSPAARGFFIDLLCLMHPEGYLLINGQPVDDTQLSRLTGEPIKSVRSWLKELGDAGIYLVDDEGRLFSSKMVKDSNFVAQAKISGTKGHVEKKSKTSTNSENKSATIKLEEKISEKKKPSPKLITSSGKPLKKLLNWWETPAGWIRQGQSQSLSMSSGESLDEFKFRLSKRLPAGRHLDALPEHEKKFILSEIDKYLPKSGE